MTPAGAGLAIAPSTAKVSLRGLSPCGGRSTTKSWRSPSPEAVSSSVSGPRSSTAVCSRRLTRPAGNSTAGPPLSRRVGVSRKRPPPSLSEVDSTLNPKASSSPRSACNGAVSVARPSVSTGAGVGDCASARAPSSATGIGGVDSARASPLTSSHNRPVQRGSRRGFQYVISHSMHAGGRPGPPGGFRSRIVCNHSDYVNALVVGIG